MQNLNYQSRGFPYGQGIAVGIGLLLLNTISVYIILHITDLVFSIFPVVFSIYFLTSRYYGKRWPVASWRWGLILTAPLIGIIVLWYVYMALYRLGHPELHFSNVSGASTYLLIGAFIACITIFLASSIGAYVGARAVRQKETK